MTFLADCAPELTFGDFCEAELFFDAYLRADASTMRERVVTAPYIKKEFGIDSLTSYIPVNPDVPALKPQEGRDFLLAHGTYFDTAVCLSDDCEIATRFGRDADGPTGRLLFAPVTPLKPEQEETLTTSNWGRMLLGDEVVEIRRVFAVAAEDIVELDEKGAIARRSLDDDSQVRLATWWSAYACRRGPLVDAINLAKLAAIADARGESDLGGAIEGVLMTVAVTAWRLEGSAFELAGDEHDAQRADLTKADWPQIVAAIRNDFAALAQAVDAARDVL